MGQTVRTGNLSQATLEAEDFGEVELKADSEMRIVETGSHAQRMDLRRGHIHALIWAPPRQFVVDTPSSKTIDLGCQYDLTVDESGDGFLTVETGWVAFQFQGKEAFIPAGAPAEPAFAAVRAFRSSRTAATTSAIRCSAMNRQAITPR